ncbi:hypothetical protein KQ247_13350 [Ruegeria pomeroyi]|nr:hypothetical protein [Ruegeria pomeroyi]NVK97731.1 hypothetical protein [Ruegeria pomeroyi]NVL00382.1 hypothetical protein [Ruegeria pomeroyi]QWV07812.1 hypothetical protein KQ247_13350 [Ruegeria pomeroyi]
MTPHAFLMAAFLALSACATSAPQPVAQYPGSLPPPKAQRDSDARASATAYYLGPRGEEWY